MRTHTTSLDGILLIEPAVHGDHRGFFHESYRENDWSAAGIPSTWVQDNHSRSRKGIVRGMHFSLGEGQAKLVRCGRGKILDVVVDLRRASPTYGQWEGHVLDDETLQQLYIPIGFAHGFCVLSDVADVIYKCSSYYDPAVERGFRFDDPDVGIAWPQDLELDVSERDRTAPLLREIAADLPF
ncbi:dTDP-4-dehydrorhamnose 3,5-epimerase [Svornostia abyssi]|uniref:dTDP-4-dehydrorhamnose 3,5-epimerase n=1 Tax=Svornostia abyssi TaxID=2898438 RepID=A0ABY5PHI7_9ACTN|nr:dTDP-4-dehydrorhamnose 3,5-epimerase [Parviterribacteraceae bacterium J379]